MFFKDCFGRRLQHRVDFTGVLILAVNVEGCLGDQKQRARTQQQKGGRGITYSNALMGEQIKDTIESKSQAEREDPGFF